MKAIDDQQQTEVRQDGHDGPGQNRKFKITVRTLAGHTYKENVAPKDLVAEVTARAIKHFVAKGQISPGRYALTLPRLGGDAELDPTATLRDAGVVEDDVLVLVSCQPQIDG